MSLNSTTAPKVPDAQSGNIANMSSRKIAEQFDTDIHKIHVLTTLAADVFDGLSRDTSKDDNGYVVFRLNFSEVNQIDFLLNELVRRARILHEEFQVADFGGVA